MDDLTGMADMVWLSKREFAYYLILRSAFDEKPFNIGDALTLLEFFGSRRTARNVLKRLKSRRIIIKVAEYTYVARNLEEALQDLLRDYIANRLIKTLKSRHIPIDEVIRTNEKIVIKLCGAHDDIRKLQSLQPLPAIFEFRISERCQTEPGTK